MTTVKRLQHFAGAVRWRTGLLTSDGAQPPAQDTLEWANGNERPNEPVPEGWKQALAELPPTPEDGHEYQAELGQDAAYLLLGQALKVVKLPTSTGEPRQADPKEFVYRGQHTDGEGKTSWAHFKHRDTRNTVHLDVQKLLLVIPSSEKPFCRGMFDKVEHSEIYQQLRSLAGID